METFLTLFNWVMLIFSGWGFIKAVYDGNLKASLISMVLLSIFVYTMFFYHPA